MRSWKESAHDTILYYNVDDGRIIGQTYTQAHTRIWVARALTEEHNNEVYLGQYISLEFAKKAVEKYWDIQDRTLLEFNV
jgi:hypothetical protein